MKTYLFVAILAILCGGDIMKASDVMSRDEVIERGTEAFEEGDYEKAFELVFPLARQGDPDAQFAVGLLIGGGAISIVAEATDEERERRSIEWIRKAAIQGNKEAIMHVVNGYANGWNGLPKNLNLAECWKGAQGKRSKLNKCVLLEEELRIFGRDGERLE